MTRLTPTLAITVQIFLITSLSLLYISFTICFSTMIVEIDLPLSDDRSLKLDLFWLRDHCRCEKCYDQSTHQRKISVLDIPDDIKTKSFVVDGETLRVICESVEEISVAQFFITKFSQGATVISRSTRCNF